MKKLLLILNVFLLLVACSQTETISESQQATVTAGISKIEQITEISLEQIKEDTLAKNDKTQNLVIPINIKKGKAGDAFIIGAVFNIVNRIPENLVMKLDFVEGRDTSSNKIELSRDAGNAWVKSIPNFITKENEPYFIPITINAPENAALGTYTFDVFIYKVENDFENKIDSIHKRVNVKIE